MGRNTSCTIIPVTMQMMQTMQPMACPFFYGYRVPPQTRPVREMRSLPNKKNKTDPVKKARGDPQPSIVSAEYHRFRS